MKEQFFIDQPIATEEKHNHLTKYSLPDGTTLWWSGSQPLPAIGQKITITMNGIGPAIVKDYFSSESYLGVMTLALEPPKWLREQRQRDLEGPRAKGKPQWWLDGIGCEFGTEVKY